MWGNLPDAALVGEVLKRIDDLKARQDAMASGKLCCSTQHVFLFLDTFRVITPDDWPEHELEK